ncbi:MAG: hypothetical protein QM713_15440 [Arachnia sp.]
MQLLIVLAAISGCAQAAPDSPWGDIVADVRDRVTSELHREILADGTVSDAEFNEAFKLFSDCLSSNGFVVERQQYKGMYSGFFVPGDREVPGDVLDSCYAETLEHVEAMYFDMRRNPNNEDALAVELACLKRSGLVQEEYSMSDYASDLGGDPEDLPFDLDSEAALDCFYNV